MTRPLITFLILTVGVGLVAALSPVVANSPNGRGFYFEQGVYLKGHVRIFDDSGEVIGFTLPEAEVMESIRFRDKEVGR